MAPAWKVAAILLGLILVYLLSACAPEAVVTVAPAPSPTLPPATHPAPTLTDTQPSAPTQTGLVFDGPLSVIITSPTDDATVSVSPVQISGQADPGTVITINDVVLLVDQTGAFTTPLPLESGTNIIEITASDANNRQEFGFLTINFEP